MFKIYTLKLSWKDYFEQECRKLAQTFEWGNFLPRRLKTYKGKEPLAKYMYELDQISNSFSFSQPAPNPCDSKKPSVESHLYSHNLEEPNPSSVMNKEELKKMLFKTPLLDDQYHALQKNEKGKEIKLNMDIKHKLASGSFLEFKNNTFVQGQGDVFQGMKYKKEDNCDEHEEKEIEEEEWEKVRILNHYRAVTEKIEKDLKDIQSHSLAHIKQQFISYFCNKYEKMLCTDKKYAQLNEKNRQEYVKKAETCFMELRQFIRVLEETICIFYRLGEFKNCLIYFLFSKENMLNFVTSIIFDDYIYPLIYEIQKKIDKSMIEHIEKQLPSYQNFKPQDFDISEKFCLNERTVNYIFLKRKADYLEKLRNSNEKCEETTTFSMDNLMMGRASTVQNPIINEKNREMNNNSSLNEEETMKLSHYNPYYKAIKNLKKISNHKSPLHKLKHIMNISKLVLQEIRDFYEGNYYLFDDNLGGDEMLSIYVYIVAKTNMPGLITDCTIIDKFITSNLTNSIYGYYLVTIQVCLKYLTNFKSRNSDEERANSSKLVLKELMESYDEGSSN